MMTTMTDRYLSNNEQYAGGKPVHESVYPDNSRFNRLSG